MVRLSEHTDLKKQRLIYRFGEKFYKWFLKKYGWRTLDKYSIFFSQNLGMYIEDYYHYEYILRNLRQIEVDKPEK